MRNLSNDKRKNINIFLISVFLTMSTFIVFAEDKDVASINMKIKKLEDNIAEIRRDQLNYKIEKDLLKETFSSNYQTINIVLALTLGIFTIIGIFGIRDIGSIRKEYLNELVLLR